MRRTEPMQKGMKYRLIFMRYGVMQHHDWESLEKAVGVAAWTYIDGEGSPQAVVDENGNEVLNRPNLLEKIEEYVERHDI